MKCKFCFATFQDVKTTVLPKGHLSKTQSLKVIDKIIDAKYEKITFAGGEPTLCPWLDELIIKAKNGGLTTMVVTNGARLSDKFLNKVHNYLDWVTLSIDSINEETMIRTGRVERKGALTENFLLQLTRNILKRKIRLKLNTVVTSENYTENLSKFVIKMKPERWKIMQVLPVSGQNDNSVESLLIDSTKFAEYVNKNSIVESFGIKIISENNEAMKGSYIMLDPAGRFFDNVNKKYKYSRPILEVGIEKAFSEIRVSSKKFIERGGIYDWK